jgi:hypothetical protein
MNLFGLYISIYSGVWWILAAFVVATVGFFSFRRWVPLTDAEYDRNVGPFEDALDEEREKARRTYAGQKG